MGIIDTILRRNDYGGGYRTVDGGHPAPYPDMTDEQLYNYEVAFNIQNRTFATRPAGQPPPAAEAAVEPAIEPAARAATQKVLDSARFSARRSAARRAPPKTGIPPERETEPASASTAPEAAEEEELAKPPEQPASAAPLADASTLDLSKPVRLVTTRQPVEIITTRARHPLFKVHGYIGDATVATVFTLDGRLSENGPCFLENIPEPRTLYLNLYPNRDGAAGEPYRITQHESREQADAAAEPGRLSCVALQVDPAG